MCLLSLLFHLGSYYNVSRWFVQTNDPLKFGLKNKAVTINFVPKPKKNEVLAKKEDLDQQKILETPLKPTERPDNPRYRGQQDHKTLKETKLAKVEAHPKAADPGQGFAKKTQKAQSLAKEIPQPDLPKLKLMPNPSGQMEIADPLKKPRNKYEALIPSQTELKEQIAAGYRDYVDDQIEAGDRIDINTADYRYIGYFTAMRKAIELVWNYPYEAVRRGLRGEVGLEFVIAKDGTISKLRVISSSGHVLLDESIVEAIRLAAPFAPLPDGFSKEKLLISGSFRYILTNYAGAY